MDTLQIIIEQTNFKWYLPAIDELENIVTYGMSHEFFSQVFVDNLYWSSQPAYNRNYFQYYLGLYGGLSQSTSGVYMLDDLNSARATRYDPVSGTLVSSDIYSQNKKEGYFEATTGLLSVNDNYNVTTPNSQDGDVVFKYKMDSGTWTKTSDIAAYTSYKRENGSVMSLPDGIQPRTSLHRVRCIYNPTPTNRQLGAVKISENPGETSYDRGVEKRNLISYGSPSETIQSEDQIPETLTIDW